MIIEEFGTNGACKGCFWVLPYLCLILRGQEWTERLTPQVVQAYTEPQSRWKAGQVSPPSLVAKDVWAQASARKRQVAVGFQGDFRVLAEPSDCAVVHEGNQGDICCRHEAALAAAHLWGWPGQQYSTSTPASQWSEQAAQRPVGQVRVREMQAERPQHKASPPRGDARLLRRGWAASSALPRAAGTKGGPAAGAQSGVEALRPPREPGAPAAPSAPRLTERQPRRGGAGPGSLPPPLGLPRAALPASGCPWEWRGAGRGALSGWNQGEFRRVPTTRYPALTLLEVWFSLILVVLAKCNNKGERSEQEGRGCSLQSDLQCYCKYRRSVLTFLCFREWSPNHFPSSSPR